MGRRVSIKTHETPLRSLEHAISQRVISAYRTVSCDAALLLARIPPLCLLAPMWKWIYESTREFRERGEYSARVKREIKKQEFSRVCELWRAQLERPNTPGEHTKMAVVLYMEVWMARTSGSMSFIPRNC